LPYCQKCDTKYEAEEECMCPQYTRWMVAMQYGRVPADWIRDWWEDELYCDRCKSGYWFGGACDCSMYQAWGRERDGGSGAQLVEVGTKNPPQGIATEADSRREEV
jgi:hypothetical protein